MSEMVTERACEILDNAQWRGIGNWANQVDDREIDERDAIAIAQGILAQQELTALRLAVEPFKEVAREVKDAPVRLVSPDLAFQNTAIEPDVWHALLATEQKEGEGNG